MGRVAKEFGLALLLIPAWTIYMVVFLAITVGVPAVLVSKFELSAWQTIAVASLPIIVLAVTSGVAHVKAGAKKGYWV